MASSENFGSRSTRPPWAFLVLALGMIGFFLALSAGLVALGGGR